MKRSLVCHNCGTTPQAVPMFTMLKRNKVSLSEQDILDINAALMTNGFHSLTVSSVEQGRDLMKLFLQSLNYYHEVACLTLEPGGVPRAMHNSYSALLTKHLVQITTERIEEYLLDEFDGDFLWIEVTEQLRKQPWFDVFTHKLCELGVDRSIPVMFVEYASL